MHGASLGSGKLYRGRSTPRGRRKHAKEAIVKERLGRIGRPGLSAARQTTSQRYRSQGRALIASFPKANPSLIVNAQRPRWRNSALASEDGRGKAVPCR